VLPSKDPFPVLLLRAQEEGSDHLAYEQITLLVWGRVAFHVYADSIPGSDLELDPLGSVSLGQLGTLGPQLVRRAATINKPALPLQNAIDLHHGCVEFIIREINPARNVDRVKTGGPEAPLSGLNCNCASLRARIDNGPLAWQLHCDATVKSDRACLVLHCGIPSWHHLVLLDLPTKPTVNAMAGGKA